jgi:hypothetical protein
VSVLVTAEIVAGACLAAALLALAFIFARRRLLARGGDLMLCDLRPAATAHWRAGLLRFDDASIAWIPLLGVTLRPAYCWDRQGLDLGSLAELAPGQRLEAGTVHAFLEGTPVSRGPRRVELALGSDPYTALRAWLEATPPERRPVDW